MLLFLKRVFKAWLVNIFYNYYVAMFCQIFTWQHLRHEFKPAVKRFAAVIGFYELLYRVSNSCFPALISQPNGDSGNGVDYLYVFIVILAGIYSLWRFRARCGVSSVVHGSNVRVSVEVKKVLKQKGDIAITCNTTFDTHSVNGFVKHGSLQWDFQQQYFKDLDVLDEKIAEAIKHEHVEKVYRKRKKSNQKNYAVGTIARISLPANSIECSNHVYLVAISSSLSKGGSVASFTSVQTGIECLWHKVLTFGPTANLSVPVFGTGQAGVKESAMLIIKEIIRSFVAATRNERFVDHLHICIHPKDVRRMQIDFYELDRFIKVQCSQQLSVPTKAPNNAIELDE